MEPIQNLEIESRAIEMPDSTKRQEEKLQVRSGPSEMQQEQHLQFRSSSSRKSYKESHVTFPSNSAC